jgi:CBS domain-containing protein
MMRAAGQGAAVVADRAGRLLGICTERDLVFRVMAEGRDPGATPVRTVMSSDPQTVRADMLFGHALHLMHEAGVRHMPVVDGFAVPSASSLQGMH